MSQLKQEAQKSTSQITVRGYAAQKLRTPDPPLDLCDPKILWLSTMSKLAEKNSKEQTSTTRKKRNPWKAAKGEKH